MTDHLEQHGPGGAGRHVAAWFVVAVIAAALVGVVVGRVSAPGGVSVDNVAYCDTLAWFIFDSQQREPDDEDYERLNEHAGEAGSGAVGAAASKLSTLTDRWRSGELSTAKFKERVGPLFGALISDCQGVGVDLSGRGS